MNSCHTVFDLTFFRYEGWIAGAQVSLDVGQKSVNNHAFSLGFDGDDYVGNFKV